MGLKDIVIWKTMDLKQKHAESKQDAELRRLIHDRYIESNQNFVKPDGHYYTREMDYLGEFFIVYGSSPIHTNIYSSFTESHVLDIQTRLRRVCKLESYVGVVSLKEPIPINEIVKKITYPTDDIFKGDYEMFVRLGMWATKYD